MFFQGILGSFSRVFLFFTILTFAAKLIRGKIVAIGVELRWLEHWSPKPGVGGSSPSTPAKILTQRESFLLVKNLL